MSDQPSHDDTSAAPHRGSTTGTPLWVMVFGIIVIGLVLLLVIMMLAGGHTSPIQH